MRRHLSTATVAVAGLLMIAASGVGVAGDGDCRLIAGAGTVETDDDVQVCEQQAWIKESDNKVANLGAVPTWTTEAPTASVASGAGGGSLSAAAVAQNTARHDPEYDAVFEGEFTGNIDTIGLELFLFTTARTAATNQAVALELTIDDLPFYTSGEADRTPLRSGGNAVSVTEFGFTNVHAAMERFQEFGIELGDDVTHTVRIAVSGWFSVNDNVAYVYDTTEVPSNITFNAPAVDGLGIRL